MILVTGGLGYIGSHTVVVLQQAGYEVILLDNLSNSSVEVLDSIEKITTKRPLFYEVDVTVYADLEKVIQSHANDIQGIIHFAAKKAVSESMAYPSLYYQQNMNAWTNVLHAATQFSLSNIVFSSSSTVYGQPESNPITEDFPYQSPASSIYAHTKQLGELFLQNVVSSKLKGLALRYFNPIGAHASAWIGEQPQGIPNNLMPYITQVAIGIQPFLRIFGADYPTPDGTCVRDYIHVVDLANAHLKAINLLLHPAYELTYDVYNIGTGLGYSVLDVMHSFNKVYGKDIPYKIVGRRAGDVPLYYSDPNKANEKLGWKAQFSLDDMTADAWRWENHLRNR